MAVQGKERRRRRVDGGRRHGYSNGEHGALCEQDKVTSIVPRPENGQLKAANTQPASFQLRPEARWRCPAGETLSLFKTSHYPEEEEYTSRAVRRLARSRRSARTRRDG